MSLVSDADRAALLAIAREAIVAHLSGARAEFTSVPETLARHAGAFVTLHKRGDLCGCIGHVEPNESLYRVVARCAVAAATADPRFPAIRPEELATIEIEISVLGPLERVSDISDIEIGRHGLVVSRDVRRGLLLPQVATEWGWDRATFLAQTCFKAGLPRDGWQTGATIWKFEAEVFGHEVKTGR